MWVVEDESIERRGRETEGRGGGVGLGCMVKLVKKLFVKSIKIK